MVFTQWDYTGAQGVNMLQRGKCEESKTGPANRACLAVLLCLACAHGSAAAQQARTLRGLIATESGEGIRGANVFVVETLDGTLSDSTGHFVLSTRAPVGSWLIAQRIGFRAARVQLTASAEVRMVLQLEAIALPALQVQAGRFQTGSAPDAELTSLQVVTTPGASADVYRALQTFPGLQTVDEGAGLFVRGGDIAETRVFLNDAVVLSPYRYESPTGGFFGAFDPFLLDGIHFSSGGFGARYGDALSGVAALRTLGRPERLSLGATASLAALSGTASTPVGSQLGARATLTRSHTGLMFRVNGTTTEFTHEPEGRDASFIGSWVYGRGELRFFALDQWSELGVFLEQPSFSDALDAQAVHGAQVLSWEQALGAARLHAVVAQATAENSLSFGSIDISIEDRLRQLRTFVEWPLSAHLGLSLGAEGVNRRASFEGRRPQQAHDGGAGAPTDVIRASIDDDQRAAFLETDWTPLPDVRAIVGVRSDRSRSTGQQTWDPRASIAVRLSDIATLTGAWGIYHQVPEPALFDNEFGSVDLPSMRAEQRIAGLQVAQGPLLLRVEAYYKRYHDLAQLTRDRDVAAGGVGNTRGLDVFVRWPSLLGITGRTSFSYIKAERTDPNTGILARSPFDITHVTTSVWERQFGQAWALSVSLRSASGRPFTPVISARYDSARALWQPNYGAPNSERLPSFRRIDMSVSRLVPLPHQRLLVLFAAANNLSDRKNVYEYRYDATYSTRTPVRSQFKRSIYFGGSFTY